VKIVEIGTVTHYNLSNLRSHILQYNNVVKLTQKFFGSYQIAPMKAARVLSIGVMLALSCSDA
jgi:hypothetical protein